MRLRNKTYRVTELSPSPSPGTGDRDASNDLLGSPAPSNSTFPSVEREIVRLCREKARAIKRPEPSQLRAIPHANGPPRRYRRQQQKTVVVHGSTRTTPFNCVCTKPHARRVVIKCGMCGIFSHKSCHRDWRTMEMTSRWICEYCDDIPALCPFCDADLPPLNPAMTYEVNSLRRVGSSAPNRRNPDHVDILMSRTIDFCIGHRRLGDVIPDGLAKGYPDFIDFEALPRRVESHHEHLKQVAHDPRRSLYFDSLSALVSTPQHGASLTVATAEFAFPGYYGWKGKTVIFDAILHLFRRRRVSLHSRRAVSGPLSDFEIYGVLLVREAAIQLIREDNPTLSTSDILGLLEDSKEYGKARFPDADT